MKNLIEQAERMMQAELKRANTQHTLFNTPHEGWAVMKEEIEEATDELDRIIMLQANMWHAIKADVDATAYAQRIQFTAKYMIAELAQVGAMAMKYEQSFKGGLEGEK